MNSAGRETAFEERTGIPDSQDIHVLTVVAWTLYRKVSPKDSCSSSGELDACRANLPTPEKNVVRGIQLPVGHPEW
jgi:hypothetical protein